MTTNQLLKIIKIQEIDIFFTKKGFTREFIHSELIYPNFFISRSTYYEYLRVNAKAKLTKKGIDWKLELDKISSNNYNYNQLMDILKDKNPLSLETYHQMLKDERKKDEKN